MPRRAENRNRAQKRFDSRAPVFAVFALRGVNGKRDDGVNWNQHPEGFCQVSGQITGQEELREGKNEDGQMKQHDRINQIGDDLARNAGAVVVVIGEQTETGVEPPAVFAGFNQREVKRGQPAERDVYKRQASGWVPGALF